MEYPRASLTWVPWDPTLKTLSPLILPRAGWSGHRQADYEAVCQIQCLFVRPTKLRMVFVSLNGWEKTPKKTVS